MGLFDPDMARAIVREAVRKKLRAGMFDAYPDLQEADLIQDCLLACLQGWHRFNPVYSPKTFILRITFTTLLDISRVRSRERVRIQGAAIEDVQHVEHEDVAGWCAEKYAVAKSNFERYRVSLRLPRSKAGSIDRAQAAVLFALQIRLNLSCRKLSEYIERNPDIVRALRLHGVPSKTALARARAAVPIIDFSKKKLLSLQAA